MKMGKEQFLLLMHFPREWLDWDMYPDELFGAQLKLYKRGDERASEHDRNGAFHWWLLTNPEGQSKRKAPSKAQLKRLVKLTFLDPDKGMAADVRTYIAKAEECDQELLDMMKGRQSS
jgi:hypothetical protein